MKISNPISDIDKKNSLLENALINDISDWEYSNLENHLIFIRNGITKSQNKEGKGLPVTRIETIAEDAINQNKVGYIENISATEIEKYQLQVGDILFSHINSEPQIGRSVVYTGNPKILIHGMNLLCLRTKKNLNPNFLNLVFQFYRNRGLFIGLSARAVNQNSINQGKLKNLKIPTPPFKNNAPSPMFFELYSKPKKPQKK